LEGNTDAVKNALGEVESAMNHISELIDRMNK